MKKTIFLTLLVLSAFTFSMAQVAVGVKGGLNFANADIETSTNFDADARTGYHAGIFFDIGLAGFNIMPEVLYSFKGTDDIDLTYIEVPVLFKKGFAKVLNVHVGPQFGFLTSAEGNLGAGDEDIDDFLKSSDLSAVLGVGLDLPGGLSGGARYVFGLSDINDGYINQDTEIRNRTFQVYVGYKLFGN